MRGCCRPPTPYPRVHRGDCRMSRVALPVPRSASCSSECHRQRRQRFGGDVPEKSFHLSPGISPRPFTVPTRNRCAS